MRFGRLSRRGQSQVNRHPSIELHPWKGYFDIIAAVDEFVIFDEVQFTRGDWRNRNRIVRSGISRWLTIPVRTSGRSRAPISTIEIAIRSGRKDI
jgi:hypothetical protein